MDRPCFASTTTTAAEAPRPRPSSPFAPSGTGAGARSFRPRPFKRTASFSPPPSSAFLQSVAASTFESSHVVAARAQSFDGGRPGRLRPPPPGSSSRDDHHRHSTFSESSVASSTGSLQLSPLMAHSGSHRGSGQTPLSSPGLGHDKVRSETLATPPPASRVSVVNGAAVAAPMPPPPMSKVAELLAQMLCYLWFAPPDPPSPQPAGNGLLTPDPSPTMPQGAAVVTQTQLVPDISFITFVENTLSTTQVSTSVVLLSLLYVHRLKASNAIVPAPTSERRVVIVALMLANKILDDHTYTARTWSEVSGLPLECLKSGEIEFLEGLQFQLHVDIPAFEAWFRLLHGLVQLRHAMDARTVLKRRRANNRRAPYARPGQGRSIWSDASIVLEGIVTPLRNAPSMRAASDASRRPSSGSTENQAGSTVPLRNVLPIPAAASGSRARSSSPVAYLGRDPNVAPANWLSSAVVDTPATQDGTASTATHKRTVADAPAGGERASKRSAAANPVAPNIPVPGPAVAYDVPVLRSGRPYRLPPNPPPAAVPQPAPRDDHRLVAPVQHGPQATGSSELYYYSLAAGHRNGGQLMRHQPVAAHLDPNDHPAAEYHDPPPPYVFGPPWQGGVPVATPAAYAPPGQPFPLEAADRRFSHLEPVQQLAPTASTAPLAPIPPPVPQQIDASWHHPHPPTVGRPSQPRHHLAMVEDAPTGRVARSAFSSPLINPLQSLSIHRAYSPASFAGEWPGQADPLAPGQHGLVQAPGAVQSTSMATATGGPATRWSNFSNAGIPSTVWSEGGAFPNHAQQQPQGGPVDLQAWGQHGVPGAWSADGASGWRPEWGWPAQHPSYL